MEQAEKLEIAMLLRAEGRLKHRTLGEVIRARGGSVSNEEVRDLYRQATGRSTGRAATEAVQEGEAPMLPSTLRDLMSRLEVGIVSQLTNARAEESERARSELHRLRTAHAEQVETLGQDLESLHAELNEVAEELASVRSQLAREREEVTSLRATLAEAERARIRETERCRTEVTELSGRLEEEMRERRAAESTVERARGETAAIAADRDVARQRHADLEQRLRDERDARTRAEGERDAARQQAEVMRDSALELRARLEATEEVQRQLQTALERLERPARRVKS